MAKRIIKPDSGNTLVLQEDNGSIDALTVETNGDVTLAEKLIIDPTKGIQFRTSTGGSGAFDSGILDDYEEGTWIPVPKNNDNTALSSNVSVGWYRKIGKLVWVQGWVKFSAAPGGLSQHCRIDGFPFSNIATDSGPLIPLRIYGTRPSSLTEFGSYWGLLYNSVTFFKFFYDSSGTLTEVLASDLSSDSNIQFSFIYSNG